jgi:hypothetical protein
VEIGAASVSIRTGGTRVAAEMSRVNDTVYYETPPQKIAFVSFAIRGEELWAYGKDKYNLFSSSLSRNLGLRFGADEFFESQGRDIKFQLD